MTEAEFQAQVVQFAKLAGWWVFHVHDSRRSAAGFPDLTMARGSRLVFAELKTDTGRASATQLDVMDRLRSTCAEVYLWRPSEWDYIEAVLRRECG